MTKAFDSVKPKLPWDEKTSADRARPRECIRAARDALDRAYGIKERAAVPLLIEALDWLRRGLEQMAEVSGGDGKCQATSSDSRSAARTPER